MADYSIFNEENPPNSGAIMEAFLLAKPMIRKYRNVGCSISGGADSDILIDLVTKSDPMNKVKYVFFNTGLEFEATRRHIKALEIKYGVKIEELRPVKSIVTCCREYGLPFISKGVSEYIERLQACGFKWEDRPFEELLEKYCREIPESDALDDQGKTRRFVAKYKGRYFKGSFSALCWWSNHYSVGSRFNISHNRGLREFMIDNPPGSDLRISNKCCHWTKKKVVHDWNRKNGIELNIFGIRKSEGGRRSTAHKSCFSKSSAKNDSDEYKPLFFFEKADKEEYEKFYHIEHSDCYTRYGMTRTGCAGCPFGRDFEKELIVMRKYEPNLYKVACNVFSKSYEYTRQYKEYIKL